MSAEGVRCPLDLDKDEIIIDLQHIFTEAVSIEPTKRRVIGIVSKIYDPTGLISPVVVRFKILFQELCQSGVEWDEPLTGLLRERWKLLVEGLHSEPLRVPRWCLTAMSSNLKLVGFCDASLKAYAAIVYVVSDESCMFLASKTRVAPLKTQTIPRLELLGALLLARVITSVRDSLRDLVR